MATSKRVTTVSGGMVPDLWPTLALSIRHVHLVRSSAERQLAANSQTVLGTIAPKAIPQPEPTHGGADVPARIHSARLAHGKLQVFCGSFALHLLFQLMLS